MITLTTFDEARDGFRHRDLRQALYDAGEHLMGPVIVNLHGEAHVARRRLENRLFRRDTFAWYEAHRTPKIIEAVLEAPLAAGHGELGSIARRTMMTLSVDVAGVDVAPADLDRFHELMHRLSRASIVAHTTGDPVAIVADGDEALAAFETEFFEASRDRRRTFVDEVEAGTRAVEDLPLDVLTTLLRNQDDLHLPDDVVLREVAYFPWVGSHSTSAQLVHAMHHLFEWLAERPEDRDRLVADDALRQRFVHESMRLHPASPVAMRIATCDVELRSGRAIPEGEAVTIDVVAANRDPSRVGPDPDRFDPYRQLADSVAPWGLSFGFGTHACLGQELAGGLAPDVAVEHHLLGSVAVMAGVLLAHGARPDPDDPPARDPETTRVVWGRYPVTFDA